MLAAALVLYGVLAAPHGHTAELSNGICRQIKAQLKEMALKSHESEVALQLLNKTC